MGLWLIRIMAGQWRCIPGYRKRLLSSTMDAKGFLSQRVTIHAGLVAGYHWTKPSEQAFTNNLIKVVTKHWGRVGLNRYRNQT